jgi:hypothetical protein
MYETLLLCITQPATTSQANRDNHAIVLLSKAHLTDVSQATQFSSVHIPRLPSGHNLTLLHKNRQQLSTKLEVQQWTLNQCLSVCCTSIHSMTSRLEHHPIAKRDWFSGKILRCHPSSVGEPWVRFPDHAFFLTGDELCSPNVGFFLST